MTCRWMRCLMTMGWFGLFNVSPTLAHCVWPRHLAGRRSPEASLMSPVQTCSSRFGAAGFSPEGGAAPADWQNQISGPCLN